MLHEDKDGGDFIGKHIGVASGGQEFPGQGNNVKASGQLVEETWVAYK